MLSTQEIRQLQTKELHDELARSTRELIQVRMDIVTGTSKESHRLAELKKHIARIKTIMNQQPKEVAAPKKEEMKSEAKPKKVVKASTRKAAKAVTKAKAAVKKATKSTKK
jgi:ribosomal protein L29